MKSVLYVGRGMTCRLSSTLSLYIFQWNRVIHDKIKFSVRRSHRIVMQKVFTFVNVSTPEHLTRKSLTMDTGIPSATKEDKLNSEDISAADKVRQQDVDGWLFRKPKETYETTEATDSYSKSRLDPHSETYEMNHERRGVALIFNHIHFTKMTPRHGTIKDCTDFSRTLKMLSFEVRVYADKSAKTIRQVLESTAAEDHSNADCFLVAVMTHGESGLLHSHDELYPVDTLWNFFTGDKCTTLAGKPKLFFIQACRGERLDKGVKIIHETDSGTAYSIPAYGDILVAYSTYDGYYSWRNPDTGSWFIQSICEELKQSARNRDLLTMLTFVNRRVAIEYQSYVPQNRHFHERKQIPSIVSMLTRLVYFTQKETIKSSSNQIESFQKSMLQELKLEINSGRKIEMNIEK